MAKKKVKKKKATKKKTTKNKATKKKVAKKVTKRKRSPRKRKLIAIDDVYRIINKVQVSEKEAVFAVDKEHGPMVKNIIRDLELPCHVADRKEYTEFKLSPSEEKEEDVDLDTEFFDDEIVEEGFLF